MGARQSKPREPPIRRTGAQPSRQTQRAPTPPAASRSNALGSNLPGAALHRAGTERSKRRLMNPWNIFRVNSKRSGSTGDHPPQTRTLSPHPAESSIDTQTNGHEVTPGARGDRADRQRFNPSEHGAIEVDREALQTDYDRPGVQESKTTKEHGGRPPRAMRILPPHNSRLGNKSEASPAVGESGPPPSAIPGNTDSLETPAGETTEPPLTAVFPTSQAPHTVADNPQTPKTPAKTGLHPIPKNRQRSVFKRIDCVLRLRLNLRVNGHSSLKPSASIRSLPSLTAQLVTSQPTELDKESPHPSLGSRPQPLRHRFSLSELRDGLLSSDGKRSAKLNDLDCTDRLSKGTGLTSFGGFSDVSQAWLDGRLVAVKALRATNLEGPDEIRMRKRLGREIHVWASLRHPHVLEFLGFAFDNGKPCLISPWCENGTLQEYLKNYEGADRRLLVRQIADGLKYLHVQNPPVIHGDFKTANVLITDQHIPKICDFGGSKHLGESKTGFTTAGLVLATIRYCAPEILGEGQHHTLQSDVYAFACVALETMTGKGPFWKTQNGVVVSLKVVYEKQTPSPDDHLELKEDDKLWELLRQCWSYQPSDRPTMIAVCNKLAKEGYGPLLPSI